ncbi:MAG: glucosidase [Bryobacterales bacterium]|nr:glucosidase [Bryobacterales bacterium]
MGAERDRLLATARREKHWRKWGPYLSDRAWGTVREDYSANGDAWNYLPHDWARSKAYRWGEDGLLGVCDNHQRLCFSVALWNGRDPILKERLFGLTGPEGNHGEDVKELYYYLDSTPTHSYLKALYKYPQNEFPYDCLTRENQSRKQRDWRQLDPEFELLDTGVFQDNRYWDVFVEYAKADTEDILIRITIHNRGQDESELVVLPTVWFRNTWAWGRDPHRPVLWAERGDSIAIEHATLGRYSLWAEDSPEWLFTENETNTERLCNHPGMTRHYKDAFHERIVHGRLDAVNHAGRGTKAAPVYRLTIAGGQSRELRLRLTNRTEPIDFNAVMAQRSAEADEFYSFQPPHLPEDARRVQRQAFAGLLWSKQFYHYVIEQWLEGDPAMPPPPQSRKVGRNSAWVHVYNDDVLTMPDKWEYPWFAAWDSAFHMITMSMVDPEFAKAELSRFLREWYMHPNGQIPAYEWKFEDVNPPVHAWACWRIFKIDGKLTGKPDLKFLEGVFHKLLMNFTWWVNRKDTLGNNIFEGGFLGLDNIGVFDRSAKLPDGATIEQSDGTSWMAMYCLNMLRIAIELAQQNPAYEDIASKFFEHFLYIAAAMNSPDRGLWDEEDGFYYDRLRSPDGIQTKLKVRSMVGLIPLCAVDTFDGSVLAKLPGFHGRMQWFLQNRPDLAENIASVTLEGVHDRRLLALCHGSRMRRILQCMLDSEEFLSAYGIRSLSAYHRRSPYIYWANGQEHRVDYEPAESTTGMFGGNSNWRGPIWWPVNYLLIESLQRFHHYYGDQFQVEFPTGSCNLVTLGELATQLSRRLARLFVRDGRSQRRPVFGDIEQFQTDPHFKDYLLFYEYFHGDNGAGLGASHQTGWTSLVAKVLQQSGV